MGTARPGNTGLRCSLPDMQILRVAGFSLLEVLLSVFLSTLLISGITVLLSASVAAYRLQLTQDQLEESGRYARDVLITHISQAGHRHTPWQDSTEFPAVTNETIEGNVRPGDQLGLQRWSDKNCYGNENPVTDSSGWPRFYLLQVRFWVNASKNLAITCRYGASESELQTQINNFGLVENVESLQVLFAEDTDGDGIGDGWVKAQSWQREKNLQAVKIAMLLTTQKALIRAANDQITLLDENFNAPADGRLRRVTVFTSAIRGRL